MQELKAPDDRFPAAALRAVGYGAVWHGQKSWNGVAILARGAEPVETRCGGDAPGALELNELLSNRANRSGVGGAPLCMRFAEARRRGAGG